MLHCIVGDSYPIIFNFYNRLIFYILCTHPDFRGRDPVNRFYPVFEQVDKDLFYEFAVGLDMQ